MKKFILKSGKEVKMGDSLYWSKTINFPNGVSVTMEKIPINEWTLPELIKSGVLIEQEDSSEDSKIPMDISFYINKVAEKLGLTYYEADKYFSRVMSAFPASLFSMLLKEVAIELDKKYKDHIENSPEIYAISTLDGRISKINKAGVKNYRNFAAFRTIEDAKIACRIVRPLLKEMFKGRSEK